MTDARLAGTTALVFGGTSGIGLSSAKALAQAGASVVVIGRSEANLKTALAQLPGSVSGLAVDVADRKALALAMAAHPRVDHLVVSIGGGSAIGPYRQLDEDGLRRTFEGKFWMVQRVTQAVLPKMQSGSVTWITGAAARTAIPGMSSLAATNGALHAMIGPLARELAPVRINAVSPGFIDTPYWKNALDDETRQKTYQAMADVVPVKRVGAPEDIASAVLMCVTNTFMTGSIIDCDGGRHVV